MPNLNLKTLQQRFRKAVTEQGARQSPAWLGVKDTAPIPYQRRLDIYQFAYFARIHESLADDFEELKKLVGDKNFEKICRLYLTKYPSRYASLSELGRRLPQFLLEERPWAAKPYLSALAAFEWEVFLATVTANPKLHSPSGESATNAAQFFFLHPAVRLFESIWEVDRIKKREKKIPKGKSKLFWVIHRQGHDIYWYRISAVQHEVLTLLFKGHATDSLVATFEKRKVSQRQASVWFKLWAENNIITGFQNAQTASST